LLDEPPVRPRSTSSCPRPASTGAPCGQKEDPSHARATLEQAITDFAEAGVAVSGQVGDENPLLAVGDVLRETTFDEIIVSTLPAGPSRWLKRDLPHRVEREYGLPVTHVVAASEAAAR
jgi:GABA permease